MKRREIEHYEILKKLGAGGSGVVYLANDTLLQRPVVLKMLKRGVLSVEQMRTTVLREARLASAIEHPNVCAIYEVGEAADEAYIVMQYVPGQSLDQVIARGAGESAAGAFGRHPDRGWSAGGAPAGHLSSRSEAGERDADRRRPGEDSRLRPGAAARSPDEAEFDPAQPTRRKQMRGGATYTARGGTIGLHGAGAVCHRAEQRAERSVCAGRDPVRDW